MEQTTAAPNATAGTEPSTTATQINVSSSDGSSLVGAQTQTQDWTSGFNDDLKGYVSTKGFKDPAAVLESYRNFEKLHGVPQERLLKLPEKADDPNWQQIYDRLGKPKEAKDYKVEVPKELGDENYAKWAKDLFHKSNLTNSQAETISKEWNAYMEGQRQAQIQEKAEMTRQQEVALKKEWGAAFEQNSQIADRAVDLFGEHAPKVLKAIGDTIGYSAGMKVLYELGTKMGEDSFVSGSQTNAGFSGKLTPEQARYQLQLKKSDPEFTRRYIAGEAGPREEMRRLHEMIVAGS